MYMANITLYVKDSDLELITKAKSQLGNSMSALFVDCVRERMNRSATTPVDKMAKIVLLFWNEKDEPSIRKSFIGRWLVGSEEGGPRAEDDTECWDAGAEWSIAQSEKGAIVVYRQHCNQRFAPTMATYRDFEEFRTATGERGNVLYPQNVIAEAASALGEPYEIELNI
jgi:hypothetical protein